MKVNTLLELYDGQLIHCVGLFEEDEAKFRQLIEQPSSTSESVVDEKFEPLEILSSTEKTDDVNSNFDPNSVETLPKREESFPVMVSLADVADHDAGDVSETHENVGDADEDDSLDESFEKISPESPME